MDILCEFGNDYPAKKIHGKVIAYHQRAIILANSLRQLLYSFLDIPEVNVSGVPSKRS